MTTSSQSATTSSPASLTTTTTTTTTMTTTTTTTTTISMVPRPTTRVAGSAAGSISPKGRRARPKASRRPSWVGQTGDPQDCWCYGTSIFLVYGTPFYRSRSLAHLLNFIRNLPTVFATTTPTLRLPSAITPGSSQQNTASLSKRYVTSLWYLSPFADNEADEGASSTIPFPHARLAHPAPLNNPLPGHVAILRQATQGPRPRYLQQPYQQGET